MGRMENQRRFLTPEQLTQIKTAYAGTTEVPKQSVVTKAKSMCLRAVVSVLTRFRTFQGEINVISTGSIAKVLGYVLLVIPGAAKFSDPALVGQAAVVISNLVGLATLVFGEVKKNQEAKKVAKDVAITKAKVDGV